MSNTNLNKAKRAKQDEFYTQLDDIQREMNAYLEYNPNVFRGKTVLLPCDDPDWSNFTKYFVLNFEQLGLKKLVSTSYAADGGHGKVFVLDGEETQREYLTGDGDFRSDEVTALRDEADIVITNPPFSLFREFMVWLNEGDVLFSVIGNSNAITYKEIFPLIKDNHVWLDATGNNNDMVFRVPETVEVKDADRKKAERMGYPSTDTEFFTRMGNSCWFANIEHGRRHEPLRLMSMKENQKYNKRIISNTNSYKKYDNYDAIEVPVVAGIPNDYAGVMGVPISFLDKYCPEQFEIVGCSYNYGRPEGWDESISMSGTIDGNSVYKRILIRHINPVAQITPIRHAQNKPHANVEPLHELQAA